MFSVSRKASRRPSACSVTTFLLLRNCSCRLSFRTLRISRADLCLWQGRPVPAHRPHWRRWWITSTRAVRNISLRLKTRSSISMKWGSRWSISAKSVSIRNHLRHRFGRHSGKIRMSSWSVRWEITRRSQQPSQRPKPDILSFQPCIRQELPRQLTASWMPVLVKSRTRCGRSFPRSWRVSLPSAWFRERISKGALQQRKFWSGRTRRWTWSVKIKLFSWIQRCRAVLHSECTRWTEIWPDWSGPASFPAKMPCSIPMIGGIFSSTWCKT